MNRHRHRNGFTLMETMIALGLLSVAMVLVAQVTTWSLAERARTDERLAALDLAANVLETARACPWADLTPEWAAARKLPEGLAARLHEPQFSVRVAPEASRPLVKRVIVELRWRHQDGAQARDVMLTALFADRSTGGAP